jgi:stage II sporulation protein B
MIGLNKLQSVEKGVNIVDKPNKGNTITIKLNGEKQTFIDEEEIDSKTSNSQTVINIDSNHIEQDVFLETAAAQESVDESFDWIIPETSENDIEEYKIVSTNISKKNNKIKPSTFSKNPIKKNGKAFGSILISSIFAILIGTTFGFIMLKLVISDHNKQAVTEPKVVEEKGTGTDKVNAKTTSAVVKPLTAYVVQEGLYSSKEAAKDAARKVAPIGIPSQSIGIGGKEYLFLGVADSQGIAKTIGGLYKEKGVKDVFAKPLTIKEKTFSDINENEKGFLEAVPAIYQSLAKMTSNAIVTKSISEDSTKAIDEQLKNSGIKNDKVIGLKSELAAAEDKIKAYQKLKDTKSLSEAQQHLLNFLALYYSM